MEKVHLSMQRDTESARCDRSAFDISKSHSTNAEVFVIMGFLEPCLIFGSPI